MKTNLDTGYHIPYDYKEEALYKACKKVMTKKFRKFLLSQINQWKLNNTDK